MPGMVYASVEHPPVLGQKIKSYDDKGALKVPGVQKTHAIDTFKPPHLFQPLGRSRRDCRQYLGRVQGTQDV